MRLISEIFERQPQVWVLLGLLMIASGVYLGFEYSVVFAYIGLGFFCFVYGVALYVLLLLDGPSKAKTRPLSRDFISIGDNAAAPAPQPDQQ